MVGDAAMKPDFALHGFIRDKRGEFHLIDFPGLSVPCTAPRWINERGMSSACSPTLVPLTTAMPVRQLTASCCGRANTWPSTSQDLPTPDRSQSMMTVRLWVFTRMEPA